MYCSIKGCSRSGRLIRGWCKYHRQRWWRTGDPLKTNHEMHGRTKTTEYVIWRSMKQRCSDKNHHAYGRYGGRGITVCDRWLDKDSGFRNFLTDMGIRPVGTSLDRIDNNGNYEPSNCRWATRLEQANNKRNNRLVTYRNKTQTMAQWARELDISQGAAYMRLKRRGSLV